MNNWCSGRLSVVAHDRLKFSDPSFLLCITVHPPSVVVVSQYMSTEYGKGFRDLNGEFWYGLKVIKCLTQTGQWELRVDFELPNKTSMFAEGSASEEYPLTISGFSGIAPTNLLPVTSSPLR